MFTASRNTLQTPFRLIVSLSLILFSTHTVSKHTHKNIKVLVLIIASDQFPIYVELQRLWRLYMHTDPKHIEAYFIKGDEHLPKKTMIERDIIWSRTDDGWPPASAGILNKTILSLERMMPRIHEFDYILRTNLSSFYMFPRLLRFLKKLPKTGCYCGSHIGDGKTGSGCGFIISPDIAKKLVRNKKNFLNLQIADDLAIGQFLHKRGIKLLPQKRMDFFSLGDWYNRGTIPQDIFHFRIKNNQHKLRLTDDIYIYTELLNMFYSENRHSNMKTSMI
jgi:hypothetical protein